jgi:hypothetical protein
VGADWTIFTTVRNHWDYFVSWWFKLNNQDMPLDKFIYKFIDNNKSLVENGKIWHWHAPFANRTLYFPKVEEQVNTILTEHGLPQVKLPKVIDSDRNGAKYQVYYKKSLVDWVAREFEKEIAFYGFRYGD